MYFSKDEEAAHKIIFGSAFSQLVMRAVRAPLTKQSHTYWNIVDPRYLTGVWGFCGGRRDTTLVSFGFFWPNIIRSLKKIYSERFANTEESYAFTQLFARTDEDCVGVNQRAIAHLQAVFLAALPPGSELRYAAVEALPETLEKAWEKDGSLAAFDRHKLNLNVVALPHRGMARQEQSFTQLLECLSPLTGASLLKIDLALISHCPRLFQLLYYTLQHARQTPAGTGFDKWGLCWQSGYLLFNMRRAYASLDEADVIRAHLDNTPFGDFQRERLGAEAINKRTLKLGPSLNFSSIYHAKRPLDWTKREAVERLSHTQAPDYNDANYVQFSLESEDNLASYAKKLAELDEDSVAALLAAKSRKRDGAREVKRYWPPVTVTLNAYSLGFYEACADYAPMTCTLWTDGDDHYITYPDQYASIVPSVQCQEGVSWKHRRYGYNVLALADGGELRKHRVWKIDGKLSDDEQEERVQYLKAFHTLCQWIADSTHESCGPLFGEYLAYASPVTERADVVYPHPFNTLEARVQFLRMKETMYRKPHVFDHKKRVSRASDEEETRSARVTEYDQFVLWYVANVELKEPSLQQFKMNTKEYAKYVCHRWMPWRRPSATMKYLVEVPDWDDMSNAQFIGAKDLLTHRGLKELPIPFTVERPRTGAKLTQFIYEQDKR